MCKELIVSEYLKYELRELRKIDLKLRNKLRKDIKIFFRSIKDEKKGDFFSRYHTDPKFKEKHKKYMLEKVKCKICGKMIARNYMTTHHRTKKCLNYKNMSEKIKCEICGQMVARNYMSTHHKTKKCLKNIKDNLYLCLDQNEILKKMNRLPFILKNYLFKMK